ncbi:hypothetical protein KAZ01_03110, partial [Candidatus Gracilibacteria bacterium]|nr:hypothetical protein [Candidatus Gracilibacteria bacterium]
EPNIINGKIDLVKNSNSLIFYFHITKDFEEICKICKSSVNSNGITLFGNILKIKELNGCIILIKGKKLKESENGFFEQNNIISHELRHIRDFYLNNDLNYIDIPPDNNIERALILSKKEILAYLTMARKLDEIYSTLTNENGMYNFFRNRFFYPGLCFGSKTYNKLFINYKKKY